MTSTPRRLLLALALLAGAAIAQAQTLRIGLAEDPDALDPTLARSFVGRVVFSGSSDRLRSHGDIREFYLGVPGDNAVRSYRDVKQYRRKRRWFG